MHVSVNFQNEQLDFELPEESRCRDMERADRYWIRRKRSNPCAMPSKRPGNFLLSVR